MMEALDKEGVSLAFIAKSINKLMKAKKTIVIGGIGERIEKKIADNAIILAATKLAAVLQDAMPTKKVAGRFSHLHANIPKGVGAETNLLRQREKSLKAASEAEFEVIGDEQIN
jgi:hypothetical protein